MAALTLSYQPQSPNELDGDRKNGAQRTKKQESKSAISIFPSLPLPSYTSPASHLHFHRSSNRHIPALLRKSALSLLSLISVLSSNLSSFLLKSLPHHIPAFCESRHSLFFLSSPSSPAPNLSSFLLKSLPHASRASEARMWTTLVLVMVAWAPVAPDSFRGVDPSEVLFENLEAEELDMLLDSTIESLQRDIIAIYEDQLRLHHLNVRNLQRRRRSTGSPDIPYLGEGYWHSYYYDLDVNNRETLSVKNITVQIDPGSLNTSDVFAVNVRNMPYIYRSDSGMGYVIRGEIMEPLYLTNSWTKSRAGCHCDVDGSMECACCRPGGCQCRQSEGHSGTACVKCGEESQNPTCIEAEPEHLFVDAAVGFEYYNYYFDPEEGLMENVIIAHGNTLSLYRVGLDSLEKMNEMISLSSVKLVENAKDLGYGEVYLDHYGRHEKLRFLVVFCDKSELHKFVYDLELRRYRDAVLAKWHTFYAGGLERN
ncbi:cyclin B [Penaeus vannamei]|uniref:Cyclin B n=1 Tax=Penaeus vannamei TaxID=6689 RepID=A0A423TJK7_PENVA|nr:cyclin B [Penaeus vannamei]